MSSVRFVVLTKAGFIITVSLDVMPYSNNRITVLEDCAASTLHGATTVLDYMESHPKRSTLDHVFTLYEGMNIRYLQYAPWRGKKLGGGWMDSPIDGVGNGTLMGGAAAGWNSPVAVL
jgi:hypothetical protein